MLSLEFTAKTFRQELQKILDARDTAAAVSAVVREVIQDVRQEGDAAVLRYTEKFDRAALTADGMKVTADELAAAVTGLSEGDLDAIRQAMHCVRDYHQRTLPTEWTATNPHGAKVGERFYPIRRVGLYIPGGQVPLVSTVIMTTVLAHLAGCEDIVVCTPPREDGSIDPGLLAALELCGVSEVYKVGGVQAIAAMGLGTATLPAVDKIFGPGNAYVMEAKRQLFGEVGIDLLPGPSELMVIADETANPAWVAADLLAQAEHGTGKELIYLVSTSRKLVDQTWVELKQQAASLSHEPQISQVLKEGFLVVITTSLEEAAEVANYLAPEHLELQVEAAQQERLARSIQTAGALLIGGYSPTALGDFTAGPSHTLPTGRTGRFFSGLQVIDFMRRSSYVEYDRDSIAQAEPIVAAFARLEQLDAHGRSVRIRLSADSEPKTANNGSICKG